MTGQMSRFIGHYNYCRSSWPVGWRQWLVCRSFDLSVVVSCVHHVTIFTLRVP